VTAIGMLPLFLTPRRMVTAIRMLSLFLTPRRMGLERGRGMPRRAAQLVARIHAMIAHSVAIHCGCTMCNSICASRAIFTVYIGTTPGC